MSGELTIAVLHLNVDIGVKDFIRGVEEFVIDSKGKGAQLVVMPAPLHQLIDVLKGSKKYSAYMASISDLIDKLSGLSNKVLTYLLVTPVVHRAGSRKYLASVLITPQGLTHRVKKVLSENDLNLTVSPGRDVEVLDVCGIKLCPLIGSDINVPEVPRLCNYLGADVILSVQLPRLTPVREDILKSVLIVRAVENSIPIINLGSYTGDGVSLAPTLLVSSSGDVVDMYNNFEPSVFVVEVAKRKVAPDKNMVRYLKNIVKLLS